MTFDPAQEKRQATRYLCDEHFQQCVLMFENVAVEVTAIDFTKEGMGLFASEHIPASGRFKLSFSYENPSLPHRFTELACTLVYCNLTEVGSHCGIRFEQDQLSPENQTALKAIEANLASLDDPEDRYNLFGED